MKVILLEDVKGLGKSGELVDAKTGYFRNFLLPNKLAIQATPKNKKIWEEEQKEKRRIFEENQKEALAQKDELEKLEVILKVKAGKDGKIFGSVTNGDIAKELKNKHGLDIERKKIELKENIKNTGRHQVNVRVFPEIVASLKVKVEEK